MTSLWLVTGGARSGKSSFAERLAITWDTPITVIATAEPFDDDMAARIKKHQECRPETWMTVEEPLHLAAAIGEVQADNSLIVDCLTVWVGNLFYREKSEREIEEMALLALESIKRRERRCVVVTNDVGLGVHPETALGRRYRDCLGRVNTIFGNGADKTFFMSAGQGILMQDMSDLL